jgi:hypothetical protein
MKTLYKTMLLAGFTVLAANQGLQAQTDFSGELQGNSLRARFNANGQLFWNGKTGVFQTPKGSGLSTLSASALWIGAKDDQGNLHLGAQTYRESGADFWPGPLRTTDGSTSTQVSEDFNKVWYVTRLQIDSFRAGLSTPAGILTWPGNGNTADGFAQKMAPFVDVNSNGVYEPMSGDYPDIKGDEMLWWVFNDNLAAHTESKGTALQVEIQASAYTYNCLNDPTLNNTVFVDYKIINRSSNTYSDGYVGLWSDIDIGNLFDDRIGSEPALQLYYGYNGNSTDKDTTVKAGSNSFTYKGFGRQLPAQGILFPNGLTGPGNLNLPMSGFMYYNNDNTGNINGNPKTADQFYNLLRSKWLNGQDLTEGANGTAGTVVTKYAYTGDVKAQSGWLDNTELPGDRRGLGTFGPITMNPGDEFSLSTAYLFAESASGFSAHSIALLKNEARTLEQLYAKNALQACTGISQCQSGNDCVFPGDADHDGKAFMYDIFNLGYAFGETGPKRPYASSSWVGQPAPSWGKAFPDGTDYSHADANGDGKIDSADVLPIVLNYGAMHLKNGQRATTASPVLKLNIMEDTVSAGGTMTATVTLGSQDQPAEDVLGVAFRISFEPSILEKGAGVIDISNSQLGTQNEAIAMQMNDPTKGFVDVGIVRTNKLVKDINGLILTWKFVIDPVVIGNKKTHAKMEYVKIIDGNMDEIPVLVEDDEVYVTSGMGVKSKAIGTPFSLYPNPANGAIYLQLSNQKRLAGQVTIYTLQGCLIQQAATQPGQNKIQLNIENLPAGMYLVELQTTEGRTVQRFLKTN